MSVLYPNATKVARMNAVVTAIGSAGKLKLFTSGDALLATFNLANPAGTVAGAGVLTFSDANGAAAGILNTTATGSGTATKATITTGALASAEAGGDAFDASGHQTSGSVMNAVEAGADAFSAFLAALVTGDMAGAESGPDIFAGSTTPPIADPADARSLVVGSGGPGATVNLSDYRMPSNGITVARAPKATKRRQRDEEVLLLCAEVP